MIDLRSMTDDEINQLVDAIRVENRRRSALAAEAEAMDRIQQEAQSALGIVHEHGVEWVAPAPGDHSAMYARHQVVTHKGEQHISLVPYNHWEPDPTADHYLHTWKSYSDPTSGPVEWDPERSYTPPAAVTYKGKTYDLIHSHSSPGWEPGDPAMHAVWAEVTEE